MLWRTFLRSFYIQATFNHTGMLNFGLLFTMVPFYRSAFQKSFSSEFRWLYHSEFFNTHPIMASYIIGALIKIEEERLNYPALSEKEVSRMKTRWSHTLAAIGDRYFWKYLRPMASLAGIAVLAGTYPWNITDILIGMGFFLVCYNIPHLFHRCYGIKTGYRYGKNLGSYLTKLTINRTIQCFTIIGLFILGALVGIFGYNFLRIDFFHFFLFIATFCASLVYNIRRIVPHFSIFLPLGVSIILIILWKWLGAI